MNPLIGCEVALRRNGVVGRIVKVARNFSGFVVQARNGKRTVRQIEEFSRISRPYLVSTENPPLA